MSRILNLRFDDCQAMHFVPHKAELDSYHGSLSRSDSGRRCRYDDFRLHLKTFLLQVCSVKYDDMRERGRRML